MPRIRIPIKDAELLARRHKATRLAVLAIDADGYYSVTTWGEDKRTCDALKAWSRSSVVNDAVMDMGTAGEPVGFLQGGEL